MTLPPPSDQFFLKLARAQTRVLLLDYDGTLAPFEDAFLALPPDGLGVLVRRSFVLRLPAHGYGRLRGC